MKKALLFVFLSGLNSSGIIPEGRSWNVVTSDSVCAGILKGIELQTPRLVSIDEFAQSLLPYLGNPQSPEGRVSVFPTQQFISGSSFYGGERFTRTTFDLNGKSFIRAPSEEERAIHFGELILDAKKSGYLHRVEFLGKEAIEKFLFAVESASDSQPVPLRNVLIEDSDFWSSVTYKDSNSTERFPVPDLAKSILLRVAYYSTGTGERTYILLCERTNDGPKLTVLF